MHLGGGLWPRLDVPPVSPEGVLRVPVPVVQPPVSGVAGIPHNHVARGGKGGVDVALDFLNIVEEPRDALVVLPGHPKILARKTRHRRGRRLRRGEGSLLGLLGLVAQVTSVSKL